MASHQYTHPYEDTPEVIGYSTVPELLRKLEEHPEPQAFNEDSVDREVFEAYAQENGYPETEDELRDIIDTVALTR